VIPPKPKQPPAQTQRRVRIMSIHAAKGLEFPVVFLAGGFTKSSRPSALTEYRDEQGRKVFDLCPDSAAQKKNRGRCAIGAAPAVLRRAHEVDVQALRADGPVHQQDARLRRANRDDAAAGAEAGRAG